MALKKTVTSLDGLPEAIQSLYQQVGDVYVLQLDGDDTASKLNEFRDNNINLMKTNEEMESKLKQFAAFEGIDPDAAREAMEELQKQRDQKMISEGKLEELLTQRTEKMRSDYDGKLDSYAQQMEKLQQRGAMFEDKYKTTVIDAQIQQAVSEVASVRPGAMTDVLSRARGIWNIDEDGNLVPTRDGKVIYGTDGKDPISMNEYAQGLYHEANYLFEPNSGGNASGNRDGGTVGNIVDSNDTDAINNNIIGIASGEVKVS